MELRKAPLACLLISVVIFITGCGTRVQAISETVELAISGQSNVTLSPEQIEKASHPVIYLTLGEQPRISLGLGFDDKGLYKWLSGDGEVMITHSGRVVGFQGTPHDIDWVADINKDPLICLTENEAKANCRLSWITKVQAGNGSNVTVADLRSEFSFVNIKDITLTAGRSFTAELWQEQVTHVNTGQQWQNNYWIDSKSGRVVKSLQKILPGMPYAKIEEVKAYSKDLDLRGQK